MAARDFGVAVLCKYFTSHFTPNAETRFIQRCNWLSAQYFWYVFHIWLLLVNKLSVTELCIIFCLRLFFIIIPTRSAPSVDFDVCSPPQPSPSVPASVIETAAVPDRSGTGGPEPAHRLDTAGQCQRSDRPASEEGLRGPTCWWGASDRKLPSLFWLITRAPCLWWVSSVSVDILHSGDTKLFKRGLKKTS